MGCSPISEILQLLKLCNYVTTQKREILFNVLSGRRNHLNVHKRHTSENQAPFAHELTSSSLFSLYLEKRVSWHKAMT